MTTRSLISLVLISTLCAFAASATAEPYWIAYDGNDFPENEGWERVISHGGAIRTIEDGALVLDSRADVMINDYYTISRTMNPGPGETFIMRWRLRVDDVPSTVPWDPVAGVFSDNYTAAGFQIAEDRIRSTFEPEKVATFLPDVFHTFEFVSADMDSYELYIDGVICISGQFESVFEASRVGWGDGIQGARSLTTWDQFEFGVVPEPQSGTAILVLAFVAGRGCRNK